MMRKIIFLSEAPAYDVGVPGERNDKPLELRTPGGKRFTSKKQFENYKKKGHLIRRSDGELLVTTPSGDIVYAKGKDMRPRDIKWSDTPLKK